MSQGKKTLITLIKTNPNNPRIIKDDKFKKLVQSIKDFPEMLELRPIVVNKDMVVLWGNMRLKACKEAWLKEIPVTIAEGLTEEQEKEQIQKYKIQICKICGCWFSNKRNTDTCSRECYAIKISKYKSCKECNTIFANYLSDFCSKKCSTISITRYRLQRKWKPLSEECKTSLSEWRKNSEKCKWPKLYNWKWWKDTEKLRFKEHNLKRYYLKKGWGAIDLNYLKVLGILQLWKCFYCENDMWNWRNKHIEHMQPISKWWTNIFHNLVYSCQHCNNSKKDKTITEFAIKHMRPDWINKSQICFYAKELSNQLLYVI